MKELLIGLMIMAIGASAKSIVDVQVLKADNDNLETVMEINKNNIRSLVLEIKDDVKEIRNHLME